MEISVHGLEGQGLHRVEDRVEARISVRKDLGHRRAWGAAL